MYCIIYGKVNRIYLLFGRERNFSNSKKKDDFGLVFNYLIINYLAFTFFVCWDTNQI